MSSTSSEDLLALIRRFSLERHRYVTLLAQSLKLGRAEFDALDYLQEAGELTPGQLADKLCLTSGATTALVDRLEQRKFLTRAPNPNDRRSVILRLTPSSEHVGAVELAPFLTDLWVAAELLAPDERGALGRFLDEAAASARRRSETLLILGENTAQ